MDCIVHGVAESQTRLSDFHFLFILFYDYVMMPKLKVENNEVSYHIISLENLN